MDASFFVIWLFVGMLFAFAGAAMLDRVHKAGMGFAFGFLLGPIGVLIAWVIRDIALRDEAARQDRHARPPDPSEPPVGLARRPPASSTSLAGAPATPGSVSHGTSTIDELERLAALKEKGHITEEEFNFRKRQLLGMPSEAGQHEPQRRRFR